MFSVLHAVVLFSVWCLMYRCLRVCGDLFGFDSNKRRSRDCGRFLYGCGQVQHLPRDLHFAHAAEEVGDQDAAGVSQEQVGTVARRGHTLALWTHLKLG